VQDGEFQQLASATVLLARIDEIAAHQTRWPARCFWPRSSMQLVEDGVELLRV
jgi:hypothetical protein